MRVVSYVLGIVDITTGNFCKIAAILSSWCRESLLESKGGAKPMLTEDFDLIHKARVGVWLMTMTDGGKEIHRYVLEGLERVLKKLELRGHLGDLNTSTSVTTSLLRASC